MLLNMKAKKVEKVITALKDIIGHPLKRHLQKSRHDLTTLDTKSDFKVDFMDFVFDFFASLFSKYSSRLMTILSVVHSICWRLR